MVFGVQSGAVTVDCGRAVLLLSSTAAFNVDNKLSDTKAVPASKAGRCAGMMASADGRHEWHGRQLETRLN